MLILTRLVDEGMWIGPDVWVGVIEIRGHQIRLAIEAPREVPIMRDELTDRPLPKGLYRSGQAQQPRPRGYVPRRQREGQGGQQG